MARKKHDPEWNQSFRVEGIPDDPRHGSFGEALASKARVRRMVPNRPKGRKESGGRRPNPITAERVNHSKGKLFDKFLKENGFNSLSEYEQQCLMDSRKNGGIETFAQWKQSRVENWRTEGKWKFMSGPFTDYVTGEKHGHDGRYVFQEIDGEMRTVSWESTLSEEEKKIALPKVKKSSANRRRRVIKGENQLLPVVDLETFRASLAKGKK